MNTKNVRSAESSSSSSRSAIRKASRLLLVCGSAWLTTPVLAHEDSPIQTRASAPAAAGAIPSSPIVQSKPGDNAWNMGRPSEDWWGEIRREHGHVGPWNVLGWRIGQAALREFKTRWGRHELDIICYVPLQTPFTCLVDGVAVGAGNSLGRLDLRLSEVFTSAQSCVAVRRKDGKGEVLEFRPQPNYLKSIINQPVEKLESLSRACSQMPDQELFVIRRYSP
ncbi:MAG: formylmethanofuran dehydrogenase subunit E family protein [Candidatus Omnitrophica bacterium]|nr:formylmethanofuran dehydrogenase subunit E family protein [Candidatus Omnitrophota bacterium]